MSDSEHYPIICRDSKGRQTYYENTMGDWCKSKYDSRGNHVYNETSDGFWWKRVFNPDGELTYFKDSNGVEKYPKMDDCPKIRAIVIDDDPIVGMYMRARLNVKFKDLVVETQHEPIIIPGLDIYIIDHQFGDVGMAPSLVTEIRKTSPDALIVVMSGALTYETLTILINRGCNCVYDKKDPADNESVFELIQEYIDKINSLRLTTNKKPNIKDRIKNLFK